MKTIYKYPLSKVGLFTQIRAPITKVLTVQIQDGVPCLWAEVDTNISNKVIELYYFGTGWDLKDLCFNIDIDLTYLSTVQDGPLVWHYYYRIEE